MGAPKPGPGLVNGEGKQHAVERVLVEMGLEERRCAETGAGPGRRGRRVQGISLERWAHDSGAIDMPRSVAVPRFARRRRVNR
jgi:hypothetical protein